MSNQVISVGRWRSLRTAASALLAWARGRPRLSLGLAGGVVALMLLAGLLVGPGESVDQATVAVVERGRLVISLTETGTIRAKNNVEVKCEVEGQSTITYIVEEGTQVQEGDLLVELDSGDLETKLIERKMSHEDAKASYERALSDLEITRSRNESNVKKAEQELEFARMDLEKWLGTFETQAFEEAGAASEAGPEQPSVLAELDASEELSEMTGLELSGQEGELFKQREQALSNIRLALGQLTQAETRLGYTERLHQDKYATREDLVADTLTRDRRRAELRIAILDLHLLEQYTWAKELLTRQSAVEEAQRELERVRSEATANLAQAEAELRKREAQLQLQQERLAKIQEQVENTKITAPRAGLVVYPQVSSWRGQEQVLEVGAQVRYRQVLVQLPDLSELIVKTKVYESEVNKVRVGQRARIRVQALAQVLGQGQEPALQGEVTKIGILPDYGHRWLNPDQKTFNVEVSVTETRQAILSKLKPEMSAEVTIILATLGDSLHVPVQAVARLEEQNVCYVVRGGRPTAVPVDVGLSSNLRVQILAGLREGARVLLYPPLGVEAAAQALGLPGTGPVEDTGSATPATTTPEGQASAPPAQQAETPSAREPDPQRERPEPTQTSAEEREERRRRWEQASPEERQRMTEQSRSPAGGSPGGERRPGGGSPGGERGSGGSPGRGGDRSAREAGQE